MICVTMNFQQLLVLSPSFPMKDPAKYTSLMNLQLSEFPDLKKNKGLEPKIHQRTNEKRDDLENSYKLGYTVKEIDQPIEI